MGRTAGDREDKVKAAAFFMTRAQEAIAAAERAKSEEAAAAFYKEAETWLYMASQCLSPEQMSRPESLPPPPRRVARERRSFSSDD